jgi:hypothetical protein
MYFAKSIGYDDADNTWEPYLNLRRNGNEQLNKFRQR